MKALRLMDRVDDSFNFGGWVHTVARNLCFDELRRRQRDLRADSGDDDDTDLLAGLPSTARGFDPVQVQESNEMRRQVWAVAQRLPEKYPARADAPRAARSQLPPDRPVAQDVRERGRDSALSSPPAIQGGVHIGRR